MITISIWPLIFLLLSFINFCFGILILYSFKKTKKEKRTLWNLFRILWIKYPDDFIKELKNYLKSHNFSGQDWAVKKLSTIQAFVYNYSHNDAFEKIKQIKSKLENKEEDT